MNIKNFLSFHRGEKRGAVILILIFLIAIITNKSISYFKKNNQTDFSQFKLAINEFEKEQIAYEEAKRPRLFKFNPNLISDQEWINLGFKDWQVKSINNYKSKGGKWRTKSDIKKIYGLNDKRFKELEPYILLPKESIATTSISTKKTITVQYFKFDPNLISKIEWKQLGFKDWQINSIFNYKEKGGHWKFKSDIKKIYGLNETDYKKLLPYVLLPEKKSVIKTQLKKVNINTSNKKDLTALKGIRSEKYAAIIIKYRNSLGGFVKKEQLKEVWNLSEETYQGFENQLEIGNSKPIQFNININSAKELIKHPYINWKTANAIEKYRKANGSFENVSDLIKIHLIDNETFLKIEPYLKTK